MKIRFKEKYRIDTQTYEKGRVYDVPDEYHPLTLVRSGVAESAEAADEKRPAAEKAAAPEPPAAA